MSSTGLLYAKKRLDKNRRGPKTAYTIESLHDTLVSDLGEAKVPGLKEFEKFYKEEWAQNSFGYEIVDDSPSDEAILEDLAATVSAYQKATRQADEAKKSRHALTLAALRGSVSLSELVDASGRSYLQLYRLLEENNLVEAISEERRVELLLGILESITSPTSGGTAKIVTDTLTARKKNKPLTDVQKDWLTEHEALNKIKSDVSAIRKKHGYTNLTAENALSMIDEPISPRDLELREEEHKNYFYKTLSYEPYEVLKYV